MALYSLGRLTTNTTQNNVGFDIACGSGVRGKIMEIGCFNQTAAAAIWSLNRPTAVGTRTTPVALIAEDPADPAQTDIDSAIAFSVQPTLATNEFRRMATTATIGAGIVWTFPRGLVIAASGSIAVVDRAATVVAFNSYVVVDR